MPPNNLPETLKYLTLISHLGLIMAVNIILFFAIGFFLDQFLGTKGLMLIIFIIVGVISGGYSVYRIIDSLLEETK